MGANTTPFSVVYHPGYNILAESKIPPGHLQSDGKMTDGGRIRAGLPPLKTTPPAKPKPHRLGGLDYGLQLTFGKDVRGGKF